MAVMDYRTQDGLADYGFSIEFQSNRGWRIYIIFQSCYQGRNEGMQSPYEGIDDNGRRYVNWSAKLEASPFNSSACPSAASRRSACGERLSPSRCNSDGELDQAGSTLITDSILCPN